MRLQVINHTLQVGSIRTEGVASASLLLVGDAHTISLSSVFDTPPESVIIGSAALQPKIEE
nr:spore gernimation protein GerPD [Paenibacillus sp. YYML68]